MVKLLSLKHVVNRALAPPDPSSSGHGASVRGVAAVACAWFLAAAVQLAAQDQPRVVRKLDFDGNRAIPDEVLASAISTTNSSWFARAFLIRSLGRVPRHQLPH